jgi:hypothetical protein
MYTCEAFDEPECIRSITVDQVMKAIDQLQTERGFSDCGLRIAD